MTNRTHSVQLPWHQDARILLDEHRLVLLVGEPGVGKTTFAVETARAKTGMEPEILSGSPETEQTHVFGMWTLAGDSTCFADGPLPRALKNGSWLLVEEMNLIPVECRAGLLALRGQSQITNPLNGEVVPIPKGFRLLATSNPETMKCRRFTGVVGALYDDFLILEVPPLSPELVKTFLRHNFPKALPERVELVLKLWQDYRTIRPNGADASVSLSYRAAAHLLALLERNMKQETAVSVALVNKYIADRDMHSAAKVKAMVE